MRRAFPALIALVAVLTSRAGAQQLIADPVRSPSAAPVTAQESTAPSVDRAPRADAAVGVRTLTPAVTPVPEPVPRRADTSHNRALLVVGGVAMLVGAVVGDTPGQIIMVGGAVIGLYGLYKFLQ